MQSPPRKHGKNEIKKAIKNIISMKNNHKTPIKGTVIKISIPKQMLQRLLMAFAQVRVSYTSNKLTKLNWTNCLFFVLRRRNHQKSKYIKMIKSI